MKSGKRPGRAGHGEIMEKSRSSGFGGASPGQHEMVNFP
jgi:hypothetical protein